MSKKRSRNGAKPAVGDYVLIGTPGVTMPSDWFMARVLWAHGAEMLTEHTPPCGNPPICRQVLPIDMVRAIGGLAELNAFKEQARVAVAEARKAVDTATQALEDAREAVWAKLDEIALAVPAMSKGAP